VRQDTFHGKRILAPSTLELTFTDPLAGVAKDFRFGLGFAISDIQLGAGDATRGAEAYYWGGYASTSFVVVPEEKLLQIFMQQSIPTDHELAKKLFRTVESGTH
jgi:CubicO group peptidase (beta-lactamase class C family)